MAAASVKDWLATNRLLPSWVLSGVFHAVLVAILLWFMPYRDRPPVGDTLEPMREIGIVVTERGKLIEPRETESEQDDASAHDASIAAPSDPLTPQRVVPETPAVALPLPKVEHRPGIGPGPAVPQGLPDPKDLVRSAGTGRTGAGASGGMPGTAFMGVKDNGSRVVYVVDSSASMYQHQAMGKAKNALVASLNSLDAGQQFQIVFYNDQPRAMSLKSARPRQLYFATDLNKSAAIRFIQQIDPDGGTEHFTAIRLALSFSPEVMYVLTDSGEPWLSPRELSEIEKSNAGRTRIHCIEFGIGTDLSSVSSNFLKKLSRQNGGTHRYVDVTATDPD